MTPRPCTWPDGGCAAEAARRSEAVAKLEPRMVQRANGGWLAVSDELHMATEGKTPEEAREQFHKMVVIRQVTLARYLERERAAKQGQS
jgi:hypothetical protein